MQLEDEVLWQELLAPPDDPADTDVREAELVPGGVDRDDTGDAEVPLELGRREGCDKRTRGTVDVNGDGVASAGLVLVKEVGHLLHRLIVASVGAYMRVHTKYPCDRKLRTTYFRG